MTGKIPLLFVKLVPLQALPYGGWGSNQHLHTTCALSQPGESHYQSTTNFILTKQGKWKHQRTSTSPPHKITTYQPAIQLLFECSLQRNAVTPVTQYTQPPHSRATKRATEPSQTTELLPWRSSIWLPPATQHNPHRALLSVSILQKLLGAFFFFCFFICFFTSHRILMERPRKEVKLRNYV